MRLVLEDGTEIPGRSFGAESPVGGEVVFNTAMAGYVETLTDPSYRGQILTTTYPLVGSYGVPAAREAGSLAEPFESDRIQVQGLVVQNYIDHASHYSSKRTLSQWLKDDGITAITGVDTRTLTRRLREHGTMRGWILPADGDLEAAKAAATSVSMEREVFDLVSPKEPVRHGDGKLTVLLVDVGAKDHIVRSLTKRGAQVIRAPWTADLKPLADEADGILLANGPGDPNDLQPLIGQIRDLLTSYTKPIFGICMGNQILALAAGAETFKLPYGHRSVNQPVQDLMTRRCYVTSQNHGYAVKDDTLPDDWEPWFVNINDGTNEGIRSRTRPFSSVQFHPEARPGPEDTGFLFDDFLRLVGAMAMS